MDTKIEVQGIIGIIGGWCIRRKIYCRLCNVFGKNAIISENNTYRWIKYLREDRTVTNDMERSGEPRDSLADETIACVRAQCY